MLVIIIKNVKSSVSEPEPCLFSLELEPNVFGGSGSYFFGKNVVFKTVFTKIVDNLSYILFWLSPALNKRFEAEDETNFNFVLLQLEQINGVDFVS